MQIHAKLVERGFYDTHATLTSEVRHSELTAVDPEDAVLGQKKSANARVYTTAHVSFCTRPYIKLHSWLVPLSTEGRRFFNEATPSSFVLPWCFLASRLGMINFLMYRRRRYSKEKERKRKRERENTSEWIFNYSCLRAYRAAYCYVVKSSYRAPWQPARLRSMAREMALNGKSLLRGL